MRSSRTIAAGAFALWAFLPARSPAEELVTFVPPPCVPGQEMFVDVPATSPFCPWVEQLARDSITGGCGPQSFCPATPLTRQQMSVFLELAMRGTNTWIVDADLLDGMDSSDFVTGVGAGTGLSGGGTGGNLTLGLQPTYQLPQACTGGQHAEWTGAAWGCGNPGTGTVTSVGTGAGLTGGPITTSGTIGVAPGGITSAMIADGTVVGADIADGSIGAVDVAPAQVQLRVAAPCAPGQFMRAVNADGSVVCAADGNSGGTVTSVATGAGLTGGPITGSGTVSVAPGGITGAMIADGTIGAVDVASTQVQLRVAQACSATAFMRAVNADGTVSCAAQSAHGHFGQVWTGSDVNFGLQVVNSGGGSGLWGATSVPDGSGVRGDAYATSGGTFGVEGSTLSTSGVGVGGGAYATTGTTMGVQGFNTSTQGFAVFGFAAATSGNNYGVYGLTQSATGYGGFFQGRVHVTSDLTVTGVKSFKIDHPLDPANRYLVHAAVESSEVLNLYSGKVVLDAEGEAIVTMPDWLEALNRDFRYQLTCIGGYAPVFVASEIQDGRFAIAGGRAGLKVSWQVVATRSDAHMLAHPMTVEEDKPADERGTYLDPGAHGQPAERGRDYKVTSTLGGK